MSRIDHELSENIRIMAQVVSEIGQRAARHKASPVPLSRNQFKILRILAYNGVSTVGTLAHVLDLSNAAVSKNIDRLEQAGFVARQHSASDRRRRDVVLLEPGRNVVTDFDRVITDKQVGMLQRFTADQKATFLEMIRQIIRTSLTTDQNTDVICMQCRGHWGDVCVIEQCRGYCHLLEEA